MQIPHQSVSYIEHQEILSDHQMDDLEMDSNITWGDADKTLVTLGRIRASLEDKTIGGSLPDSTLVNLEAA